MTIAFEHEYAQLPYKSTHIAYSKRPRLNCSAYARPKREPIYFSLYACFVKFSMKLFSFHI